MIRASKQISLNANQIHFNNGFALAPIINLNGIVLRADRALTQQLPIKDFLSKHNAQVSRVRINYKNPLSSTDPDDYEYYIRIHGTFVVSQKDTKEFIDTNAAFIANQLDGLEQIPTVTNMQFCIAEQYDLCKEKATYVDLLQNRTWEVLPDGFVGNEGVNINVKTKMTSEQPILGGNFIAIKTNILVSSGRIFADDTGEQKMNAGLMAPFFSLKSTNIKFSSYANLKDALIQGETVNLTYVKNTSVDCSENHTINKVRGSANDNDTEINANTNEENNNGTLTLAIDPKIDWLNNPYHGFSPMFSVKSGVERYVARKKRDVNGEEKLVVIKAIPRPK